MRAVIIETALFISITIMVYLLQPQASQLLAYYRTAVSEFELWRLVSATFCHTNFNHLLMNIAGLLITLMLFIDNFKKIRIWPLVLFNSLFIGAALFLFETDVIYYVGLSGVLHGLFSYGVAADIGNKDRWGYLLGSGFLIKIIYEQQFGAAQSTIDLIGAPVLINAHLYGAFSGIVFYFIKKSINIKKHDKRA